MASDKMHLQKVIKESNAEVCQYFPTVQLREDVSIHRTDLRYFGKSPKIRFQSYFNICSPICPNNLDAAFFVKIYFSFREMTFLVRPLKNASFHRDYYPSCATLCNKYTDLQYFCPHNPLFYHLNLIPFH